MGTINNIRTLDELRLESRRVLVRLDLDVPIDPDSGTVADPTRIRAALPTLRHVMDAGARVIIASHLGTPPGKPTFDSSLEPVGAELAALSGWDVLLPDDCVGAAPRKVVADLREGQVALLENLRFHPGEQAADEAFARRLAGLCDVYVNDACGLAHETSASLVTLPRLTASRGCGLLLQRELDAVATIRQSAPRPFVVFLGGATLSEALELWQVLAPRCDVICCGGGLANTLLAATGGKLPPSQFDDEALAQARTLLQLARDRGPEVLLPTDLVVEPEHRAVAVQRLPGSVRATDVGPETMQAFASRVAGAQTVLWVGSLASGSAPIGEGSHRAAAELLAGSDGFTVVAGESAAAAVHAVGTPVVEKINLVSAGGEATLRLLQGRRLPAIDALRGSPG